MTRFSAYDCAHHLSVAWKPGRKRVYLASTCPPIRHPCFYGIDFPEGQSLVAYQKTEEEVAKNSGSGWPGVFTVKAPSGRHWFAESVQCLFGWGLSCPGFSRKIYEYKKT